MTGADEHTTGNPSRHARFVRLCNAGASIYTVRAAMRELEPVTLADALRFVLVHADEPTEGDYPRASARWLGMLIRETGCGIASAKRASSALWLMPTYPHNGRRELRELLWELDQTDAADVLR